ncbi:MAG: hypothetical protein LBS30_04815 [Planctomycetota bacterium]|jgi:hypothetical protein|nr:hypothetical protein [Planctomycetota bacterium]
MADVWHIARGARACAKTGAAIPPEVPYYSALLENDEGFERRDFCADAWPDVEKGDFFSYWKNKGYVPRGDRRQPVDYDRILDFFDALADGGSRDRQLFRYVLALVLVRRRRLRLDDMSRTEQGDRLVVHDRRDGGRTLEIIAPEATREDLEKAQEKLNQLFEADFAGEGDAL